MKKHEGQKAEKKVEEREQDPSPQPSPAGGEGDRGKKEPEKKLVFEDGTAVAAEGLGIHLIQDGRRRWVPNTWTQTKLGIRMDYVVMLFPPQLEAIPEGAPMPDQAPEEPLF